MSPRTTAISIERTHIHEGPSSSSNSIVEEHTPDAENASASASQESVPSSEGSWTNIEPSDSVSRPRSTRRFVDQQETSRDVSERRVPAPDPIPRRPAGRKSREKRESRTRYERRRRTPSPESSSVESTDDPGPWSRRPQYAWVPSPQNHQPYPSSNVGISPFSGFPPQAGVPPQFQSLVPYQHPDPYAYFQGNPFTSPMYGQPNPLSPMGSSSPSFVQQDPYRSPGQQAMMPYAQPVQQYFLPAPPQAPAPAPSSSRSGASSPKEKSPIEKETEERFNKLQELILAQDKERVAREKEWQAKLEAERKAAEAKEAEKAAKAEAERIKNEAVADAAKKAKDQAEDEANAKAKEAQAKHEKAMKEATEATENAKKAEKAAKEDAAKLKPSPDDSKAPITFKDVLGRRFQFPWRYCKTWKGMEDLICQAFVHVDIEKYVQERQYDLLGPNGIILPQVWEQTVQPDWSITMEMWPGVAEEQKKLQEPKIPPPPPGPAVPPPKRKGKDRKKRRSLNLVVVPSPPDVPGAVAPDPNEATSSGAVKVDAVPPEGGKSRRRTVPGFLQWTAGSQVRRR